MNVRVMKFGGTSVRTAEARMTAALRVISTMEQGSWPVVVVSAMGRRGEPYATDTLADLVKAVDPATQPDERELDLVMSVGELISAVVFAQTLKGLGYKSLAIRGGQAGIRTDGVYGNARIISISPVGIVEAISRGAIPVVCGFQGVWTDGKLPGAELTTLGRGGSDTTAAAIAAALHAEAVEIYTDVDGVKTADPDFVPSAPTIDRISSVEVAEIAHLGAKVLHPRAAEIAMRFGVPLWVKNTLSDHPGTEVMPTNDGAGQSVTGVTHTGKLVHFQFGLSQLSEGHRRTFQAGVFATLAKYGVSVYMASLGQSSLGFAVPRQQYADVKDIFDALVVPMPDQTVYLVQAGDTASRAVETQQALMESMGKCSVVHMDIAEGCTMVSLVGRDLVRHAGVFYRAFSILQSAGIPVLQTTDSDLSISMLIPESELRKAVALLHAGFAEHAT
ncbi:MAG: aspartate kinase [bacterium]